MVIRLLDGAHEEQHAFNINGMSWRKEITDPVSPIVQEQTIGISEAFNIKIDEHYDAGDYLYCSGSLRWDVESGMWGIFRVMSCSIRYRCECICRNIGHWWEEQWYDKYM